MTITIGSRKHKAGETACIMIGHDWMRWIKNEYLGIPVIRRICKRCRVKQRTAGFGKLFPEDNYKGERKYQPYSNAIIHEEP